MLKPTCNIAVECAQGTPKEVAHEISNCFNFIAPVTVLKSEAQSTRFIMEVILRHHPYWMSGDEGSDETWEQVVKPWLAIKLRTFQNTIEAYGKKKVQKGEEEVQWGFAALCMDPYIIDIPLTQNRLPEDAMERIEALRAALNAGENPFDEQGHVNI